MKTTSLTDLSLVTTLVCLGFPIEHIDKTSLQQIVFHFKNNSKIQKMIDSYYRNEITVEPKHFSACRKEVVSRMHSKV